MKEKVKEADAAPNIVETNTTPVSNSNDGNEELRQKNNGSSVKEYLQETFEGTSSLPPSVKEFRKRFQKYIPIEGFTWPDDRSNTENAIIRLKEKQVILIKGINSYWFDCAAQRIASVLQASRNKLWPGCDGVYRVKDENKLPFGFWRNFEKFNTPTIIAVPTDAVTEYLRNFILAGYDRANFDFKEALKAVNVFLIILVPDNAENAEILKSQNAHRLLKEIYATWTIPATKLELQRKKGKAGELLYKRITNDDILRDSDETQIYKFIKEEDIENDENIVTRVKEEILIKNTEAELVESACKEETELKLRLIYCGAFFNDLTPADFNKISMFLLNSQIEEIKSAEGKITERKSLNDIWSKPVKLDRVMSESLLTNIFNDTKKCRRIGFTRHIRLKQLRWFFLEKKYNIFLSFTEELIKQNVMFSEDISEELYIAIIKVFTLVIKDNYNTYDGNWLFEKVIDLAASLNENIQDENTREMLNISEKILDISILKLALKPLGSILKELLLSGEENLTSIVKHFFKKLMDSGLKKNVAIGLAIDLYNELRETGNFPEEELDKYFKRALNEGNFDDKFYAYRMMVKNLYYNDLYQKTSDWLANTSFGDESWTKKFAWLYKLDYCILTFYIHFQINKVEKEYELFSLTEKDRFGEDFVKMLKDITSEKCIKSWHELLQYEDLFSDKFFLLEKTITQISNLNGREDDENRTPLSLAGDVLENWFYILFLSEPDESETIKGRKLKEYVALIKEVTDKKRLTDLESYWRRKAKNVYSNTISTCRYDQSIEEKERENIIQKLKRRRNSLDLLIDLM